MGAQGEGVALNIEEAEARMALLSAARRTAELVGSLPDADLPVDGLEWTVGEVGAHLAISLLSFVDAAQGRFNRVAPYIPDVENLSDRLSGFTAATLLAQPERDPKTLAHLIRERVETFLALTADRSADESLCTPWYGAGVSLDLATATCLLLGEQLVHGYDLAKTVGRHWPIEPADACLVLRAGTSMLPLAVNPATARELQASFEVRIRRGPRFLIDVHNGTAEVQPFGSHPVDCRISAEPVAFVLIMYGRISRWRAIIRGKLLAWGRKPWLALKLDSIFYNP